MVLSLGTEFYLTMNYFSILFCGLLIKTTQAAEPMKIPPKQDVYEYHMKLEWKLTMAHYEPDGPAIIMGWNASNNDYYARLSDQHLKCDATGDVDPGMNLSDVMFMDGLHQRIISINGHSPGFPIIVYNGSEVVLHLENNLLLEGITLHFHGLDKRNQWFMDGVALIQQCPIAAMSTFTYRFIADTPGTHWYHGHIATDRGQGLAGPFVVLPENGDMSITLKSGAKVVPDVEYLLLVQDWPLPKADDAWYHHIWETMKFLYEYDNWDECWAPTRTYDGTNVGGSVPISAILINDKGWHNQSDIKNRPWNLPIEKFKVKPGQMVLFRLINVGRSIPIMLSIEDHKLHVVSTDGVLLEETVSDFIISFPGERFDFIVFTDENPGRDSFYMIAETLEYYDYFWQKMEPNYAVGLLEYEILAEPHITYTTKHLPDVKHTHCSFTSRCIVVNCPWPKFPPEFFYDCLTIADLKSHEHFHSDALKPAYDDHFQEFFLNMHYDSYINGWRFEYPKAPPYFYHENVSEVAKPCVEQSCTPAGCFCFLHLNLTLGNVIQLTVYNMGNGSGLVKGYAHPLHIHGLHFYVIKQKFGSYNSSTGIVCSNNPDLPCNYKIQCNNQSWTNPSWLHGRVPGVNLINPPFKDTVAVPAGGYVVLRFKADNPGWWIAHCHIILHHLGGMAFALKTGEHNQMPAPPEGFPCGCGLYDPGHPYSESTMNLDNNATMTESKNVALTDDTFTCGTDYSLFKLCDHHIVVIPYVWFVSITTILFIITIAFFLFSLYFLCKRRRMQPNYVINGTHYCRLSQENESCDKSCMK